MPGPNVYRQAPTPSAASQQAQNMPTVQDNREKKVRKRVERVALTRPSPPAKPQPQPAEAPPPVMPAWTGGRGTAWIQKAREESTARVVPAQSLQSSSQLQESSSSATRSLQLRTRPRFIPDFKRLQLEDIKPFRFVNIEPLQGLLNPDLDQGWRGHPGVIVGTWHGEVGVVGTTSWGGKGADEKFDRAQDLLLYKKSFFPIFGAPEPMGDVAFDRLMLRTNGPVAFAHNTMIDGRSVRFIPLADFRNECSKYFRQGTRESVFLARGSAQNLEEQLWYLAGLDQVPWKASDHEGLKKWRYFKMREGFKPTQDIPPEARIEAA